MVIKSLGLGIGLIFLVTGCTTTGIEQQNSLTALAEKPVQTQPATADKETKTQPATPEKIVFDDLWERLRAGMALPELDSNRVRYYEKWYSSRPEYMNRMIDRARPYLYHIVQEVEKRGMPMEVALLPAIESAYQPNARSHARAVGMWQFIPSTGKHYGLKQNWMYEGRSDIHASTQAALGYLSKLNNDYDGDWFLSFAAYNAGEGKINRAMKYNLHHGRPATYSYLTKIRRETKDYVPKLIAVRNLIRHPDRYGLNLASIPNRPYFAVVWNDKQVDINELCRRSGVSKEDFFALNPGFKRGITVPSASRKVLVAMEHKENVRIALRALPTVKLKPRPTYNKSSKTYRVRRGDSLGKIAKRYHTSVARLKRLNGLRSSLIRTGQRLKLPGYANSNGTRYASSKGNSRKIRYTIRKGDTLSRIAKRNQTTVSSLKQSNGLRSSKLRIGQRLVIFTGNQSVARSSGKSRVASKKYRVRSGDNLSTIAKRFGVSVSSLKKRNGMRRSLIRTGQHLSIPVRSTRL